MKTMLILLYYYYIMLIVLIFTNNCTLFAMHDHKHQLRKARLHKTTMEVLRCQDHWKSQMIVWGT